jgi:sulfoxide reductase heme-binding subunit YedZ
MQTWTSPKTTRTNESGAVTKPSGLVMFGAHLAAMAPALWLLATALMGALGPDPIGEATRRSGRAALVLLGLALVPGVALRLMMMRGSQRHLLGRLRKLLGLYAFGYAALHLAIFLGWDYAFQLRFIALALVMSPALWAGLGAFLILLLLALTSSRGWQKRLGKGWARLHQAVYLAAGLAALHYAWVFKELRLLPLLYALVVAALLILRLPIFANAINRARFQGRRHLTTEARRTQREHRG